MRSGVPAPLEPLSAAAAQRGRRSAKLPAKLAPAQTKIYKCFLRSFEAEDPAC